MPSQRAGEVRVRILAAGYEAFATRGYHSATTAEICRRAGVSNGTLFHYFPTKEDLLLSLLEDREPVPRTLTELVDRVVAEFEDPLLPAFAREISGLVGMPRVGEVLARQDRSRRETLAAIVAAERQRGGIRDDLADAVVVDRLDLLLSGAEGLAAMRGPEHLSGLAELLRQLVTEAVRPGRGA